MTRTCGYREPDADRLQPTPPPNPYSTVTLLARFLGLSMSVPRATAV